MGRQASVIAHHENTAVRSFAHLSCFVTPTVGGLIVDQRGQRPRVERDHDLRDVRRHRSRLDRARIRDGHQRVPRVRGRGPRAEVDLGEGFRAEDVAVTMEGKASNETSQRGGSRWDWESGTD